MRNSPMKQWSGLMRMIRPGNAILAAVGILVGYFFTRTRYDYNELLLLISAGMCALGFGNVINDWFDIETDRVSHPDRPLVTGETSPKVALLFSLFLAFLALACGFMISPLHGYAVLIPLALLWGYAWQMKGVPLVGNVLVALLVAYTLLFGALGYAAGVLIIPAALAALGNFLREVIKDFADEEGDTAAGLHTTAMLPESILRIIVITGGLVYLLLALVPYMEGYFGETYVMTIFIAVFPLHTMWAWQWRKEQYASAAFWLKMQMIAGLAAILLDRFWA